MEESKPEELEVEHRDDSTVLTERQYEAELQEIRAKTMYNLIEEVPSRNTKKQLLLLTNNQAQLFTKQLVAKLVDALELRHKPKLVVKLVHSECGLNQLSRCPQPPSGIADTRESFPNDGYLFTPPGPAKTLHELESGENRLFQFFRDILVPLCARTNAVVLAGCSNWDVLSSAFSRAVNIQRASWGADQPFTTIGFGYNFCFHYNTSVEGTYAHELCSYSKLWQKKQRLVDTFMTTRWGERDNWVVQDLVRDFENYILFDALKMDSRGHVYALEDMAPSAALEGLVLSHFAESLPCICFRTTRSNYHITNKICVDMLNAGRPVVFLDLRARPLVQGVERTARLQQAMEYIATYRQGLQELQQNDPYDNCNIAWLRSILEGYNEKASRDTVEVNHGKEPLFEAIARRMEESNHGAMTAKHNDDVAAAAEFMEEEYVQNFWQRELIMQEASKTAEYTSLQQLQEAKQEERATYRAETEEMLMNPLFYGRNVADSQGLASLIHKLVRMERIPSQNSLEGLVLLREAWNTVDMCTHIARSYKFIAKIGYLLLLLLGIASMAVTVLRSSVDGCSNGTSACDAEGRTELTVFLLALGGSVVGSVIAYMNPMTRWRMLRNIAARIESTIWMYRTRVGPFAQVRSVPDSAELALRERLLQFRNEILTSADVTETAFMRNYKDKIYRHGQYQPKKQPKVKPETQVQPITSDEAPVVDNHQSPIPPQHYITLRVDHVLNFYRRRLPRYRRLYNLFQAVIILGSAAAAVLSTLGYPEYAAIVVSVSAAVVSWMEFHGTRAKLERYNKSMMNLLNIVTWYNSMTAVEKASLESITQLVQQVEVSVVGENNAWLSVPQQSKEGDEGKQDKKEGSDSKEKEA